MRAFLPLVVCAIVGCCGSDGGERDAGGGNGSEARGGSSGTAGQAASGGSAGKDSGGSSGENGAAGEVGVPSTDLQRLKPFEIASRTWWAMDARELHEEALSAAAVRAGT